MQSRYTDYGRDSRRGKYVHITLRKTGVLLFLHTTVFVTYNVHDGSPSLLFHVPRSHTRLPLPPIIRSQNNLITSYHIRPSLVPRFQGERIDHPCAIRFAPSSKRVVARASHGIPVAGPHRRAWFPRQDAGTHPQTHKHNNTHAQIVHLVVGCFANSNIHNYDLRFFTSPFIQRTSVRKIQKFSLFLYETLLRFLPPFFCG